MVFTDHFDEYDSSESEDVESNGTLSEEENDKVNEGVESLNHASPGQEDDACPICLNEFTEQQIGVPDNCKHIFCVDCILEWSKNSSSCPVDRIKFENVNMFEKIRGSFQRKLAIASTELTVKEDDLTFCEICGSPDNEDTLLLCDGCDHGFHCACLTPSLPDVPNGEWFCSSCRTPQQLIPDVQSQNTRFLGRTRATERVRAQVSEVRLRHSHRGNLGAQLDAIVDEILTHSGSRFQVIEAESSQRQTHKHTNQSRSRSKKSVKKPSSRRKLKRDKTSCRKRCKKGGSSTGNTSTVIPILASVKPLTILGRDTELNECLSGEDQEAPSYLIAQKHRQLSRSALRFNTPLPSILTLGNRIDALRRIPSSSEAVPDLLGSILSGQEILMTPSRDISIKTGGALLVKKICDKKQSSVRKESQNCQILQQNTATYKEEKSVKRDTKLVLKDNSANGRKAANNNDQSSSGKPSSSMQNKSSSTNCVSSSQTVTVNANGSKRQSTLNSHQSITHRSSNIISDISHDIVPGTELKPSNKKKFHLKRFNLLNKEADSAQSSRTMISGKKIQIKKILNFPHNAKDIKNKEDVYDPFDPTEDDDDFQNRELMSGENREDFYDPFEPTESDDEKQNKVEKTQPSSFPKFSGSKKVQNNESDMRKKQDAEDKNSSEAKTVVDIDLFTDIELDELLDSNLDAAVTDGVEGAKNEQPKSKISPEFDMFAEPESTLEKDSNKSIEEITIADPSSAWRNKVRSLSITDGSDVIKLPEFQSGAEVSQPIHFKRVNKTKSAELTSGEVQNKILDAPEISNSKEFEKFHKKSLDKKDHFGAKAQINEKTIESEKDKSDKHRHETKKPSRRSDIKQSDDSSRRSESTSHSRSGIHISDHCEKLSSGQTKHKKSREKSLEKEQRNNHHRREKIRERHQSESRSSNRRKLDVKDIVPKATPKDLTEGRSSSRKSSTKSRHVSNETDQHIEIKKGLPMDKVLAKSSEIKPDDNAPLISEKQKSKKHKASKKDSTNIKNKISADEFGSKNKKDDKKNPDRKKGREYDPTEEIDSGKKMVKHRSKKHKHKDRKIMKDYNDISTEQMTDDENFKAHKKFSKKKKKMRQSNEAYNRIQIEKNTSKFISKRKGQEGDSTVEKQKHAKDDQEQDYRRENLSTSIPKSNKKHKRVTPDSDKDFLVASSDESAKQETSSEHKSRKNKTSARPLLIGNDEMDKLPRKNDKKKISYSDQEYENRATTTKNDLKSEHRHKAKKRKSHRSPSVILDEDNEDTSEISLKKRKRKKEKIHELSEEEVSVKHKRKKMTQSYNVVDEQSNDKRGHKRKKHKKTAHSVNDDNDEKKAKHKHRKLFDHDKDDESLFKQQVDENDVILDRECRRKKKKKHHVQVQRSELKHADLTRMISCHELENSCLSPLKTPSPKNGIKNNAETVQSQHKEERSEKNGDEHVESISNGEHRTAPHSVSDGDEMYSPSTALLEDEIDITTPRITVSVSPVAETELKKTLGEIYSPSKAMEDEIIFKHFRSPSPLSPSSLSPDLNVQLPTSSQEIEESPSYAEKFVEQSRQRFKEKVLEIPTSLTVLNDDVTNNLNDGKTETRENVSISEKTVLSSPVVQGEKQHKFRLKEEVGSKSPSTSILEDIFADSPAEETKKEITAGNNLTLPVHPERPKISLHLKSNVIERKSASSLFMEGLPALNDKPVLPNLIIEEEKTFDLGASVLKVQEEKETGFTKDVDERKMCVDRSTPKKLNHSSSPKLKLTGRSSRAKTREDGRKYSRSPKRHRSRHISRSPRDHKRNKHIIKKRSRTKSPRKDSRRRRPVSTSRGQRSRSDDRKRRSPSHSRNRKNKNVRSSINNTDSLPVSAIRSTVSELFAAKSKVGDAGPRPISTISGLSSSSRHHAMQDHHDMTEDEFIPDNLIPKSNQLSALRNLVEIPTNVIKMTTLKTSALIQVPTQPSEAIKSNNNLLLNELPCDAVFDTKKTSVNKVEVEDNLKLDKHESIAPSTPPPPPPQPTNISLSKSEETEIPGLSIVSDSGLVDKDAYSPSDVLLPDEKGTATDLQPTSKVDLSSSESEKQVLNPTQILNFIGLNPQQKSAAQNAILSIAELSKHLQLDKFMKSDKKPVTKEDGLSPISIDNIEASAVEMYNKGKESGLQKKVQFQDRVVEEAKLAIKPYYERREINKAEYKEIMKRAVNKVCSSENNMEINNIKIRRLIRRYIEKYQQKNVFKKEKMRSKLDEKIEDKPSSPSRPPYEPLTPPHQTLKQSSDDSKLDTTPSLLKREPRKIVTLPDLPLPPPPPPPRPSYLP